MVCMAWQDGSNVAQKHPGHSHTYQPFPLGSGHWYTTYLLSIANNFLVCMEVYRT